jgi:hypothetical protein
VISENGTHSGFRNVVGKFTSHTVQNPKTKKQHLFHGESLKSRIYYIHTTQSECFWAIGGVVIE